MINHLSNFQLIYRITTFIRYIFIFKYEDASHTSVCVEYVLRTYLQVRRTLKHADVSKHTLIAFQNLVHAFLISLA